MPRKMMLQAPLLIAFLVIVWGLSWPISKFALNYMPPILFSGTRTLLGGILMLIISLYRNKQSNFKNYWYIYVTSAILNVILFYGLQTLGLEYLSSGLFSAIVFLQPVLVGLFSWFWLKEAMYATKFFGLILGFIGVAVICSGAGNLSGHISVMGILLAIATAVSWALGIVFVKKRGSLVDPIWLVTIQLLIGGGVMTIIGSCTESWTDIVWNMPFIFSFLFISLFVIAAGWLVFYRLMAAGEASKVAAYTFLIPLVAIITGWLFFGEHISISLLIGLLLVLSSIYFVNRPKRVLRSLLEPS